MTKINCLGKHLIIDCNNVKTDVCLDDKKMLESLVEAAKEAGSTVINSCRYHFGHNSPPGFACIVMLDESHCSAHSYADRGLLAIDIFTCGKTDPKKLFDILLTKIDLRDCNILTKEVNRFEI
jgi:S-adenosylmethionine decarboxylase